MIKHKEVMMTEQKYMGIKTKILYSNHDAVNFSKLHQDVIDALINHKTPKAPFMAMDTDFAKDSFSYMPMMPVDNFDDLSGYEKFMLEAGAYFAFEVIQKNCNPDWFKEVFKYIKENGLEVESKQYDLELFDFNYIDKRTNGEYTNDDFKNEMFSVLFKKRI